MLTTITTDITNGFRARSIKLCLALGAKDKNAASQAVDASFFVEWENVPETFASALKRVLPPNPKKNSDLKVSPSRYFAATLSLCRELGPDSCKFSFCPTRSSCVPCHMKLDTDVLAQLLLPHKRCVEARKSFGSEGRKEYNDWVWNAFCNRKRVDSKSRKFMEIPSRDDHGRGGSFNALLQTRDWHPKQPPVAAALRQRCLRARRATITPVDKLASIQARKTWSR